MGNSIAKQNNVLTVAGDIINANFLRVFLCEKTQVVENVVDAIHDEKCINFDDSSSQCEPDEVQVKLKTKEVFSHLFAKVIGNEEPISKNQAFKILIGLQGQGAIKIVKRRHGDYEVWSV